VCVLLRSQDSRSVCFVLSALEEEKDRSVLSSSVERHGTL
jgi:hypothetical protein